MEVVVDDVELLRLAADVLGGRHAVEVQLVVDGALGAHPAVLGARGAVVEGLAADRVVRVVT